MKKLFFITVFLFSYYCTVFGQRSTREAPVSLYMGISELLLNDETYKIMPSLDMDIIRQEDEAKGIPPRFGFKHRVDYNLENSGEWMDLPDGGRLWRLSLHCPEALSINLLYDQFWLPDGAKFFIYSNDYEHSIGAFTSLNNKGERDEVRGFATGLVYGNQITLEYYLSEGIDDIGIISIAYVVHGYRSPGYGQSDTCHVNINCSEGQNWQNEKNAVARIIADGDKYCTGALVNTTANDERPLLLTAHHNLDQNDFDAKELDYWLFYWHYESQGCTSMVEPTNISTSGAVILAYHDFSDFALLQLDNKDNPANRPDITPYYLGWDASGNANTGGAGIHQPYGDIKKICLSNQISNLASQFFLSYLAFAANTLWKVVWNTGITESGSSGSPLLNNNKRIIGQLTGGYSFCHDMSAPDYYGKFNISWNHNTDIKHQLKHWLDPNKTGATVLDGCGENFINRIVTTNTIFKGCSNINAQNVTITNGATLTLKSTGNINTQRITINNNSKLILDAGGEVNIGSNFEVQVGSEFEIK